MVCCPSCRSNNKDDIICNPISLAESVMSIPDSIATSEQLVLKRKIEHVGIFKIRVNNNRLELTVGKDYFINNNIPIRYYKLINKDIKETNIGIDQLETDGVDIDVASVLEKDRRAYQAYIEAFEAQKIQP